MSSSSSLRFTVPINVQLQFTWCSWKFYHLTIVELILKKRIYKEAFSQLFLHCIAFARILHLTQSTASAEPAKINFPSISNICSRRFSVTRDPNSRIFWHHKGFVITSPVWYLSWVLAIKHNLIASELSSALTQKHFRPLKIESSVLIITNLNILFVASSSGPEKNITYIYKLSDLRRVR